MDNSVLKVITDKLSAIEERRRLALGAAGVGIWDWDIKTNTLTWDDTMFLIYNIPEESFTNSYSSWTTLVHPDDIGQTNDAIQRCLSHKGSPYSFKFRVRHGDFWRVVSAFGNCIRNESGEPIRMVGVNILEPDFCEECPSRASERNFCSVCPIRIAEMLTSLSDGYLEQRRQSLVKT